MREGNPVRKAMAFFAAVAFVTVASNASALTKDEYGCRAAIQKNASKLGSTAMKAIDGCIKNKIKNGTAVDCASPAAYDTKGKVAGAAAKVDSGIASKCGAAGAGVLGEFQPTCPSPADDDAVANMTEVGGCQKVINQRMPETVSRYILNPNGPAVAAHANTKAIQKCGNGIRKASTKLWGAVAKARGKAQNTTDKTSASYDYSGHTTSIASAITSCQTSIASACPGTITQPQLALLHSCATTGATIAQCACKAVAKNAAGATATAYEFGQVCPSEVRIEVNSGTTPAVTDPQHLTNTVLSTGWTGLGHEVDVHDGFVGRVNLACSDTDCEACAVTSNCEAGNCRCSNNLALPCNNPFVQDTCGAGNTCIVAFGSPLPLSAGGSPVCVVNRVPAEIVGTANVGTGGSNTAVNNVARVFLGITHSQPCPTCTGGTSGVIGGAGTCSGGQNNGAACTTDAIHADFGSTAYECQPTLAANISGTGLKVNLTLTDGAVLLPFDDACDFPLGGLDCACGACSGDNTVGCINEATCAGMGLGTCEKGSFGADRRPNACATVTNCVDIGNERGQCIGGPELGDNFCDGFLRKDGRGIITCSNNGDCSAVDGECPGGDCGDCTLNEPTKCFLDPIEAQGVPGQDGAELASTFCSPPTISVGINEAGGIPGGGRVVLDWDFIGYCPDGITEFELGGNNCPP